MDDKELQNLRDEVAKKEHLDDLVKEVREGAGEDAREIADKVHEIEEHARSNKLMNLAQVGDVLQRRTTDKKLDETVAAVAQQSEQEQRHNQGAKESRNRIEESLGKLHKKVDGGVGGGGSGGGSSGGPKRDPQGTTARAEKLGATIQAMGGANMGAQKDELKYGAGKNIGLIAETFSGAGAEKLQEALQADEKGKGDLAKRLSRVLEGTRRQQDTGESKLIREELAKLKAYETEQGISTGLDFDALQQNTQTTFGGRLRENFGIDQGAGFGDAVGSMFKTLASDVRKGLTPDLLLGTRTGQNKEFEEMEQSALLEQRQKDASQAILDFMKGEDNVEPTARQKLVKGRTGQDNETIAEKQLEVVEEIRDILLDMMRGGGDDSSLPMPLPGRTTKPGTNRGPRGPRTRTTTPRAGFTKPGSNMVQAKSGRFFPANSPQGRMITNMQKGPTNNVAGVVDDVLPANARGIDKLATKAMPFVKGAGVIGAVADVGLTGYEVYQNQQAVGEEIDARTGEIYTQKSATADNTEAIASTTGGLAGAGLGAAKGAALGAAIGTSVPIIGTAIGGLVGGVAGGIAGYFAGSAVGEAAGDAMTENEMEANLASLEDKGIYNWNYVGRSKLRTDDLSNATDAELQSMLSHNDMNERDTGKVLEELDKRMNGENPEGVESTTKDGVTTTRKTGRISGTMNLEVLQQQDPEKYAEFLGMRDEMGELKARAAFMEKYPDAAGISIKNAEGVLKTEAVGQAMTEFNDGASTLVASQEALAAAVSTHADKVAALQVSMMDGRKEGPATPTYAISKTDAVHKVGSIVDLQSGHRFAGN